MKRLWVLLLTAVLLSFSCAHRVPQTQFPGAGVRTQTFVSKKTVLANGLTVVAVERRKVPVFQADLVVRTGAANDPEGKEGLGNLTASLLDKGTKNRTASQIADEIDFTGGDLDVSCGYVTVPLSVHVLVEHAHLAMELLSEIVMLPTFRDDELKRSRSMILSGIMRSREKPFSVVSDAFRDMVYEGSPLHKPIEGHAGTVADINRADVVKFHRVFFLPNNAVLIVVADLSVEEIIKIAQEYFGSWQKKPLDVPVMPVPEPTEGKSVRLVDMDVNQSYVAFGHLGLKRKDPDYNAVRVMNYILGGGGFVSRIVKSIRVRQGLAYSAYSYFAPGPAYNGYFRAGLQTKIGSTSQALNSLLEEIERIRNEPVTEKELEDAKSFYEGSLPRRQETYGQVANLFVDQEIYGLKSDYWVDDLKKIKSLTLEEIQRVARKHLDPDNFIIAIATKVDSLALEVKGITKDMIKVTNP
ncbi:insulinase family protein [candidate division TA06 bacterium]|uniref:Insulinase family protein n=1 Tax=candidate division TA06 bacterium TaxID=2250710 RepID=A0A523XQY1_UNCT6|nr:MAG: insulinase family protein [candidate division TA06 bacterium]